MRIIVVGGPSAGKTYWTKDFGQHNPSFALIHGDDYMHLGWSSALEALAGMLSFTPGDWVAEGTTMALVMQKMLKAQPDEKPCDKVVWFHGSREPLLKPGQRQMQENVYQATSKLYWPLRNMAVEFEQRRRFKRG